MTLHAQRERRRPSPRPSPTSGRGRKNGGGSGLAGVAEELDVQAGAVGPASGDAGLDDPVNLGFVWDGGALGHEHDIAGGKPGEVGEDGFNFGQVGRCIDNELELAIVGRSDEGVEGVDAESALFVACGPGASGVAGVIGRGGVGEFGREAHEVAGDGGQDDGACGFDGDVESVFGESL